MIGFLVLNALILGFHVDDLRKVALQAGVHGDIAPPANALMDHERERARADLAAVPGTVPPTRRAMAAAAEVAWRIHGKDKRASGGSFVRHLAAVGAMMYEAFQTLNVEGFMISDSDIEECVSAAFTHDATEDTNKKRSRSYLEGISDHTGEIFSPLEIRYIFMETGHPHGNEVAHSLLLLTRITSPAGAKLEYMPYIRRGLPDLLFRLVKSADLQHNIIDPKPTNDEKAAQKVAHKQELYRSAATYIRGEAPDSRQAAAKIAAPSERAAEPREEAEPNAKTLKRQAWEVRYHQIIAGITLEQVPHLVNQLGTYIYGDNIPQRWKELF
jgi:hypothetical protein